MGMWEQNSKGRAVPAQLPQYRDPDKTPEVKDR